MSDTIQDDTTQDIVEQKIKLGDEEYSQEDLSKLVGLGKIAQEAEEKYNTKIDKVFPAFTKSTQEAKELSEAKSALEREIEELKGKMPADDDQVAMAKQQLKQFGVVFGDDLDKVISERATKIVEEKEAARTLLGDIEKLHKEVEKDGRPPFETVELLEYMRDNPGLNDPSKAYKYMREAELDAWKEKHINGSKRPGLNTISTSQAGSKQPMDVRPTNNNLNQLVSEALGSGE